MLLKRAWDDGDLLALGLLSLQFFRLHLLTLQDQGLLVEVHHSVLVLKIVLMVVPWRQNRAIDFQSSTNNSFSWVDELVGPVEEFVDSLPILALAPTFSFVFLKNGPRNEDIIIYLSILHERGPNVSGPIRNAVGSEVLLQQEPVEVILVLLALNMAGEVNLQGSYIHFLLLRINLGKVNFLNAPNSIRSYDVDGAEGLGRITTWLESPLHIIGRTSRSPRLRHLFLLVVPGRLVRYGVRRLLVQEISEAHRRVEVFLRDRPMSTTYFICVVGRELSLNASTAGGVLLVEHNEGLGLEGLEVFQALLLDERKTRIHGLGSPLLLENIVDVLLLSFNLVAEGRVASLPELVFKLSDVVEELGVLVE
mmetsp:Transcript_19629/g.30262  ORF Transcript_19629/g.30262 Transcript_19629/m.30262 type:complete len:365 (-) Transcript_19629:198-1292(-)|eukprot:CAMPEP_0170512560 /NCGR_PEP_ID=MMETSP0208-20121228/66916_1 /TAXON_ID=197538 /ORGANISM="Strombidium inclinatum, Strain S3" /LENGTH=364 /DNA_ID=CAMNT_0010796203 /DNA_START=872 /DNA_END=1966 /DNA_ORIENTATION=-